MSCEDLYNKYIADKKLTWQHRLTWCGLYGDSPKNSINISKFLRDKNLSYMFWDRLAKITNVVEYRKLIADVSKSYVDWADEKEKFTKEEAEDIYQFSVGAFGEIFYIALLTSINTLFVDNRLYHFTNVAPLTSNDDFGIDGTATYSIGDKEVDCALQIKFWNPNGNAKLSLKIVQGVFAQGVVDGIINPAENKTVIFCWLGTEKGVSKYLKKDENMYRKVLFIDMKTLDNNINQQVPFFWAKNLPDFIEDIL